MNCRTTLALALAAATSIGLHAQTQGGDPLRIVSGGIGAADQQRLEEQADEYNLHLLLTDEKGNYLAGVAVVVHDAAGNEVTRLTSDGPIVMAALRPGRYTVEAGFAGSTQRQSLTVPRGGHREVVLRWPSSDATT